MLRNNLSGKYIQINDIDLSSIEDFGLIGDGTDNSNKFSGNYNGGSFVIKNLKIASTNEHTGLFGYVTVPGKIESLGLTDVVITGNERYTGVLVGYSIAI